VTGQCLAAVWRSPYTPGKKDKVDKVEVMAAVAVLLVAVVFTIGAIMGVILLVSLGVRREETRFRLHGDTSARRAGLIVWSIFRDPKHDSKISVTSSGDLTVQRGDYSDSDKVQ
jgi:hypothetical protein